MGNGFYGNNQFISLSEMEKLSKTFNISLDDSARGGDNRINPDYFIECENKRNFHTIDVVRLFPDLKEHDLHNFLNRFKDVFLSQKLFSIINRKRVFTIEAVKFIYTKLVRKEEPHEKKRGRRAS